MSPLGGQRGVDQYFIMYLDLSWHGDISLGHIFRLVCNDVIITTSTAGKKKNFFGFLCLVELE